MFQVCTMIIHNQISKLPVLEATLNNKLMEVTIFRFCAYTTLMRCESDPYIHQTYSIAHG